MTGDFTETAYNDLQGESFGTFYSARNKWINKMKKYAEKYPDQVKIMRVNEDGSLVAHIPQNWFKISPPKFVSDENKKRLKEQLKKAREENKEE